MHARSCMLKILPSVFSTRKLVSPSPRLVRCGKLSSPGKPNAPTELFKVFYVGASHYRLTFVSHWVHHVAVYKGPIRIMFCFLSRCPTIDWDATESDALLWSDYQCQSHSGGICLLPVYLPLLPQRQLISSTHATLSQRNLGLNGVWWTWHTVLLPPYRSKEAKASHWRTQEYDEHFDVLGQFMVRSICYGQYMGQLTEPVTTLVVSQPFEKLFSLCVPLLLQLSVSLYRSLPLKWARNSCSPMSHRLLKRLSPMVASQMQFHRHGARFLKPSKSSVPS